MWSKLLKLEPSKISVTSSFFLLGGNSLLLMRLVSRLREQFSVDIELEEAMELSSIRLLAEKVDDYQKSNALSDISKVSDVLAEDEVEEAI
ncbi:acyl carrier protein [Pseudoalteromonas piscicida]